jgi:hypothetical protein
MRRCNTVWITGLRKGVSQETRETKTPCESGAVSVAVQRFCESASLYATFLTKILFAPIRGWTGWESSHG